MQGPSTFAFLNEQHHLTEVGWDNPALAKLWRYNLHYFDDLNARDAGYRDAWHLALIERWIEENAPGNGTGWEPFPTCLRIVNWIKWALAGARLSTTAVASLAVQSRWLAHRLEHHILGNHLFANAKALLFAGLFFDGAEAEVWIHIGVRVLTEEIPEQILSDGGHFELSTMYHALALEDLLDLVNLGAAYPNIRMVEPLIQSIRGRIPGMLSWLASMCHPDGEISFFNDAAIGIAPSPEELYQYATRVNVQPPLQDNRMVRHLPATGYVRVERGRFVAILDTAPVGPSYLPGHAHADTLSFELSVEDHRVFVNSGTSTYDPGAERASERGTAAHNTVVVGGRDSSEVWASFRVARRAKPFDFKLDAREIVTIACSHGGYRHLSGRPVHRREWQFGANWLSVRDIVTGPDYEARAYYHVHPDVTIRLDKRRSCGEFSVGSRIIGRFVARGGGLSLASATYHPGFGSSIECQCLQLVIGPDGALLHVDFVESDGLKGETLD